MKYNKSQVINTKQNGHPISTCATFSEKYFLLLRTCVYQVVINVSFPEHFAYALIELSHALTLGENKITYFDHRRNKTLGYCHFCSVSKKTISKYISNKQSATWNIKRDKHFTECWKILCHYKCYMYLNNLVALRKTLIIPNWKKKDKISSGKDGCKCKVS